MNINKVLGCFKHRLYRLRADHACEYYYNEESWG